MTTFTAPYSTTNPARQLYDDQGQCVVHIKPTPLPLSKQIVSIAASLLQMPLLTSFTSYDAEANPIFTLRHKLLS